MAPCGDVNLVFRRNFSFPPNIQCKLSARKIIIRWRSILSSICKSLSFFFLHSLYICQTLPSFPCFPTCHLYFWCSPPSLQSSLCCLVYSVTQLSLNLVISLLQILLLFLLSSPNVCSPAFFLFYSVFLPLFSLSVAYCSYSGIILRASVPQQDLWNWRAGSCKLWGPLTGPFPWVLSSSQNGSRQLSEFSLFLPFSPPLSWPPPPAQSLPVAQRMPCCSHPCRPMSLFSGGWLERHVCMAVCYHLPAPIWLWGLSSCVSIALPKYMFFVLTLNVSWCMTWSRSLWLDDGSGVGECDLLLLP